MLMGAEFRYKTAWEHAVFKSETRGNSCVFTYSHCYRKAPCGHGTRREADDRGTERTDPLHAPPGNRLPGNRKKPPRETEQGRALLQDPRPWRRRLAGQEELSRMV